MEYRKVHSAPKIMVSRGARLDAIVLETVAKIRAMVGATLGPGGQPVILERVDDLPPDITKDGVTVFKSLGFLDPIRQAIMEAVRGAAVRTANTAGDGTTTATILAEALVRRTKQFCKENPGYSPHRAIREMKQAFTNKIQPMIERMAVKCSLSGKGRKVLQQVALISANGDEELAEAVMRCYDICGDAGNVTLVEDAGDNRYEVEEIQGYPLAEGVGYGATLGPFYTEFLREPALHRSMMKSPAVVLYHGKITEFSTVEAIFHALQNKGQLDDVKDRDMVLVATWFSEAVLGNLTVNWKAQGTTKIFPLRVPLSPFHGGQKAFLEDLAAVVNAEVYDPVTNPLENMTLEGMGLVPAGEEGGYRAGIEAVEIGRDKTTVFGFASPDAIELRTAELEAAKAGASKLEQKDLQDRIARLSGGVARLTVFGTNTGDTRERVDRAEDAVCAVKGALKHGALYGGGRTLLHAAREMRAHKDEAVRDILAPSLQEPFEQLLSNVGLNETEIDAMLPAVGDAGATQVFDALQMELCDPAERGIYDSVPAVLEALKSSLAIATLLGTLGGAVVQGRDTEAELDEAASMRQHERELAAGNYRVDDVHDEHGA